MKLHSWTGLVWRTIVTYPTRSLLTGFAIALGVSMVLAAGIIGETANRQAALAMEADNAVSLEITARDGGRFETAVIPSLESHPTTAQVIPSLRTTANLTAPGNGELTIVGVSDARYESVYGIEPANGRFPQTNEIMLPMAIALQHSLNVGDVVTLARDGESIDLTVSGRLKLEEETATSAALSAGFTPPVSYVPLAVAQHLNQTPDTIDHIAIVLAETAVIKEAKTSIETILPGHLIVSQANGARSIDFNILIIQGGMAIVGLIILMAAAFVIMNAFAMAVTARNEEIGALRAVGMIRRQILWLVLGEGFVLGVIGTAAGIGVGIGLAYVILSSLELLDTVAYAIPWWAVLVSVVLGLGVTLAASFWPARRAGRVPPIVAVRQMPKTAVSHWYITHAGTVGFILLMLVLATVFAIAFIRRPAIWEGMAVYGLATVGVLTAMFLLLPQMIGWLGTAVYPLIVRRLGAAGRLAVDNFKRNPLRTATTSSALTAGLTAVLLTTGFMQIFMKGGFAAPVSTIQGDAFISISIEQFAGGDKLTIEDMSFDYLSNPIDPDLVAEVTEFANSRGVDIMPMAAVVGPPALSAIPGNPILFIEPISFLSSGNYTFFEGNQQEALQILEAGRAILLQPMLAERFDAQVGELITIPTNKGDIDVTVAGIGGSGMPFTMMPFQDGMQYFEMSGPSMIGLLVPDHVDAEPFLEEVEAIVAPYPEFDLLVIQDNIDTAIAGFNQFQQLLTALLLLAVIIAGLGVVNTTMINVSERMRELGLMRAVGATQSQIRTIVVAEAGTLGAIAAIIAAIFSFIMVGLLVLLLSFGGYESMGIAVGEQYIELSYIPAVRDMGIATIVSLLLGTVVAGMAAYFPARHAAATNIIDATRSEKVTIKTKTDEPKRPEKRRDLSDSLHWMLARRNLGENRLRTVLSGTAVTLGVAMILAAEYVSSALLATLERVGETDLQVTHGFIVEQLDVMLTGVGYVLMAAAAFLVFNTFTMTITQRQQQIGALRSLGMTRRQMMQLILVEALILGGMGTIVGLIVGPMLGRATVVFLRKSVGGIFVFGQGTISAETILIAAVVGIVVTLLAVLAPARRATHISPLMALRNQQIQSDETANLRRENRMALIGSLLALLLVAFLTMSPPGEWAEPPLNLIFTFILLLLWLVALGLFLPFFVRLVGMLVRTWLGHRGANGRLIGDNIQRARSRVILTIATLAIGLITIVSMTGFMAFIFDDLFGFTINQLVINNTWAIFPFEMERGIAGLTELENIGIEPDVIAQFEKAAEGRAALMSNRFVAIPELSFLGDTYFSYVIDPEDLANTPGLFTFAEGDWETALPIMKDECGALMAPAVALRNNVGIGDQMTITGVDGPLTCTVAGIGMGVVNSSVVGENMAEAVGASPPVGLVISPKPGVDLVQLRTDMEALAEATPGVWFISIADFQDTQQQITDLFVVALNGMMLLAVLAAALGVINTAIMSVSERQRELGLLRAVGATKKQVQRIVVGETMLMGLVSGIFGMVAGAGMVIIVVLTYGGQSWGVPDLDLWASAVNALRLSLTNGIIGIVITPLITGLVARFPVRALLRGTALQTMEPGYEVEKEPGRFNIFGFGSIRTRFVVGTAVLLLLVMGGLTAVVSEHTRTYLEDMTLETFATMVQANATMLELNLSEDTESLSLDLLEQGNIDAEMFLRFRSLIDGLGQFGLAEFSVTDQDNVVLISFDPDQLGAIAEPVGVRDGVEAKIVEEANGRQFRATAPIHSKSDAFLGAVRLRVGTDMIDDLIHDIRNALWMVGSGIVLIGIAISWVMTTPLVRATRQLAQRAARVGEGQFTQLPRRLLSGRVSISTRLTGLMVGIVVVLVLLLELVVVPIERSRVEAVLAESFISGAEWMSDALSAGLTDELLDIDQLTDSLFPFEMLGSEDINALQSLTEQLQNENVAFVILMDQDGVVQVSNRLGMMGMERQTPSSDDTRLIEDNWENKDIWRITTPVQQENEFAGWLEFGIYRSGIETYLNESRTLFRLAGVIAVLAGVLLAQAISAAITTPIRQLAAATKKLGEGDLSVEFQVNSRDELAQLANTFNEMVDGLREREWLQDMFGRFVSKEVAEALRAGQVKLEGENRVVSILFCDIRGFTARSERSTPEEIVALLNEYLPVVVDAAQLHDGTVNKFGGDSTLVIYGAPKPLQESAYNAILTALEMKRKLKQLNEQLAQRGIEPINIGVGINTGQVLAGAVGTPQRQEYTVIGDTVNLASRIESLNKDYPQHGILISDNTYNALSNRRSEFDFTDLGHIQIRGKADPVHIWAVAVKKQGIGAVSITNFR